MVVVAGESGLTMVGEGRPEGERGAVLGVEIDWVGETGVRGSRCLGAESAAPSVNQGLAESS